MTFITFIIILFSAKLCAQNDTIFFDKDWKISSKDVALYYRIKPLKIKTKDAVGYKIKDVNSLFVIHDYYLKNNAIQFQGYSEDYDGEDLVGVAKWYDENSNEVYTNDFYRKENNNKKYRILELPIVYIDYKIATKSQFIGGLEFCLDCKNDNKLFLGAGYGITSYNGIYYGLPDLHLSYNAPYFLFIKGGVSDKHAYGLAGFTILNAVDLGFGYSQQFNKNELPIIKGFTFGITFRFTNNKKVYTKLKMM
ncbi:hypothetical protein IW19_16150 [Flavobacterium reichenbachii]|uniref:Uncharacterized protein n=1 Tax=Flavobacterium reichenbachii TaxID=362418 RepID=A0A085ZR87_9FLAO|nr:hypothetical protein IW19_16150 [Flavobacterium reichenbachii]